MRVVFDLTSLHDNLSGIERYTICISTEYIKNNPQDIIYLIFKGEVYNHPVYYQKSPNLIKIVLPVKNKLLFNQLTLLKCLNRIEADAYIFLAFPSPWFFKKSGIYNCFHDMCYYDVPETKTFLSRIYYRHSFKKCLKNSKSIITISEFSKERIYYYSKTKKNIDIIYCGISNNFFINLDSSISSKYNLPIKYFLTLSTLEPRKNLTLLLQSYDELIRKGVNLPDLVLAGRKGWKVNDILSNLCDDTLKQLHFTGFIEDDDLSKVYSNAELFIFPSKYEGFGIPPLEAMACGTLVISSNAASLPEVVGDAAILFENNDSNSLKKCILSYLDMTSTEKDNLRTLGLKNVKRFDWNEEAKKLKNILDRDIKKNIE